jgi:hypothetical protein
MKPTPQISDSAKATQSFPLSDYNFQAKVDVKSSSSPIVSATKPPAFHKLSSDLFAPALSMEFVAELLCFIVIISLAAWPVVSAVIAVTRMVRNY